MAISVNAVQGTETGKTVRMIAYIYGKEAVILIDSGSSHSFISEAMASKWRNWSSLDTPMQVRVANGEVLYCKHELDCPVWISGHGFKISLKVLPLDCYDIILGIDWLEAHSPMEVDWRKKWLSFEYQGEKAVLQGIAPRVHSCEPVNNSELAKLIQQDKVWCLVEVYAVQENAVSQKTPDEVQGLINEFADLFSPPKGLPPQRSSEHTIPLLPGS